MDGVFLWRAVGSSFVACSADIAGPEECRRHRSWCCYFQFLLMAIGSLIDSDSREYHSLCQQKILSATQNIIYVRVLTSANIISKIGILSTFTHSLHQWAHFYYDCKSQYRFYWLFHLLYTRLKNIADVNQELDQNRNRILPMKRLRLDNRV